MRSARLSEYGKSKARGSLIQSGRLDQSNASFLDVYGRMHDDAWAEVAGKKLVS